ncbi:MAG: ATP-dependent helicase [Candidatus Eremiobacteraeota bacterium]|nr:ATP-dependent helicase [Candidatus Eremiobacteraeota bacterium]
MLMQDAEETQPDAARSAALAYPPEGEAVSLVGPAGTGKTSALLLRAARAGAASEREIWVTAPSDGGVARLRAALATAAAPRVVRCASFGELALDVLQSARAPGDRTLAAIDDARASLHFERAGAELFALEWTEFVSAEFDPEITGLRAPERFSAAAFRLIRKLRGSLVSPEDFKLSGLRGATAFYGKPPNFASPDLLMETPAKYRDSLRVTPLELERQRAREVDLVHILTRLYASYLETLVAHGCLTNVDAVYEATSLLRRRPDLGASARLRFASALVDDAQDLSAGQIGLLRALFGEQMHGVTLSGDETQSTRGFAGGGRGAELLKHSAARIEFDVRYGCSAGIERAARRILGPFEPGRAAAREVSGDVELYRADTVRDEARGVAGEIERLIASGTVPSAIAVITRNLAGAHVYIDALLARNVPLDVAGAASVYAYPAVADALGALWSAVDPFRHDYLLRNLEAPWLRLSDASIAILCGEAPNPQPLLFDFPEEDGEESGARRYDRGRDLRLGRNVTRGDVDAELPQEARDRLLAFRAARERWERLARTLPLGDFARAIFAETVCATPPRDARERFDRGLVERLIDDIDRFEEAEPLAALDEYLAYAERIAAAEADLLSIELRDGGAVRVLDVEAAKGNVFDYVFIVDVRAGAWPRYYVPDAFLFMPSAGMIAKENVGDAESARTAKFTYSLFKHKLRDKYNAEERRALYCAATRARLRLYVSAAGRPTRGAGTPELLEELLN